MKDAETTTLMEQLEQLNRQLDAVIHFDEFLNKFLHSLAEAIGAERVFLFLVDESTSNLRMTTATGAQVQETPGIELAKSDPFAMALQKAEWTLTFNGAPTSAERFGESTFYRRFIKQNRLTTAIPMKHRGNLLGALFLSADGSDFVHSPRHREALQVTLTKFTQAVHLFRVCAQHLHQEQLEKSILLEVGKRISSSLELEEVLDLIIDSLKLVVPYDEAAIFLINEKTGAIENEVYRGYDPEVIEKVRLKVGQGLTGWVAKNGVPVIVPDVSKDPRYIPARPETRSEMAVPLQSGPKVIGVFNLESNRENAYSEHHLQLLETFASQAALAIENARLYREALKRRDTLKELQVARGVQRALLPKSTPTVKGFSFSAMNKPSHLVSGDLYDIIRLSDGRVVLTIGDVSGKGTPSAILMADFFATYRGLLRQRFPLGVILTRLNEHLRERASREHFVTFFLGILDPRTKKLEYINAGHNPPILFRANGTAELLDQGGPALGFVEATRFEKATVKLNSGDLLVLFTDGVTEAQNPQGELFGVERLIETLRRSSHRKPSALKWDIHTAVRKFVGYDSLQDDLTLLIAKVR